MYMALSYARVELPNQKSRERRNPGNSERVPPKVSNSCQHFSTGRSPHLSFAFYCCITFFSLLAVHVFLKEQGTQRQDKNKSRLLVCLGNIPPNASIMDKIDVNARATAPAALQAHPNNSKHNIAAPKLGLATTSTTIARKRPGGIQVSTVKRIAPPPRAPPAPASSASSSSSNTYRINGLSEEKRQRVEEIRREREKKDREAEEKLRPSKATIAKPKDTSAPKRRKPVKRDSEDLDDDDDDLFSNDSEASNKKKKSEKMSLKRSQFSNSGEGYRKLGREGVSPYYLVPRKLIDEDAFNAAAQKEVTARQSSSLVLARRYGACEC
jgi:hypothetical protein